MVASAAMVDWPVSADTPGEEGASPLGLGGGRTPGTRPWPRWPAVAEEMADAREMGMRQRPFPCRYCIADPMSSSIIFATWCSVTVRLSLLPAAPPFAPSLPAPLCPCSFHNPRP
ncbi:hypothetical protein BHE74_00026672 [Ensete ventricosum]|nr:hypothetical protein GW17_00024997 [Ensete ventricosum]RWW65977.1 hypothetical protein BHE74_00026672 [Ensete ventricosum]RZS22319.1 hypothetical protein BHM03_00055074 [Ensete ventricosum]